MGARHGQWGDYRSYPDTRTPETVRSYNEAVRRHAAFLAQTPIALERERWLAIERQIDILNRIERL
jgi:hypothetical protein